MLPSGVPNLDLILGGGIPEGDVLLLVGPAGSGKTTMCLQIAFHLAAEGHNVLYVSTLSEPPMRLLRHIRTFSFYNENAIGKQLVLLNVYPLIKQSLEAVTDALISAVRKHKSKLLIIDGLTTFHDLHPQSPEMRTFVYELGASLATLECTLLVASTGMQGAPEYQFPEVTLADSIIELGKHQIGNRTVRTIRTDKVRGQAPLLGLHSLRIDQQGVAAFPRNESFPAGGEVGLGRERVSLGLPELDRMMSGGPRAGSATLLAGALGTGKTLTCLHFLLEGASRGEKGVLVEFRETPRHLMDKARALGLDLEGAVASGAITIMYWSPVDLALDEITWELRATLDRLAPQRLAVDSMADIEAAFEDDRRPRGYMASLARLLRSKGVTSLLTKEVAQVVGPELDYSDTPLAVLIDNLVQLRYVEFRGVIYRALSVIKMQDSDLDRSTRLYVIGDQGLHVLTREETAEGVLAGIARLPSELRVKR